MHCTINRKPQTPDSTKRVWQYCEHNHGRCTSVTIFQQFKSPIQSNQQFKSKHCVWTFIIVYKTCLATLREQPQRCNLVKTFGSLCRELVNQQFKSKHCVRSLLLFLFDYKKNKTIRTQAQQICSPSLFITILANAELCIVHKHHA